MVILIAWWIGQPMVKGYYLLPGGKAVRLVLTNSILYPKMVVQQKNYHWLMRNMGLFLRMENNLQLYSVHKWGATGNATAADGKQISIFSILIHKHHRIFQLSQMQDMNSRCGMVILFIFYPTVARS